MCIYWRAASKLQFGASYVIISYKLTAGELFFWFHHPNHDMIMINLSVSLNHCKSLSFCTFWCPRDNIWPFLKKIYLNHLAQRNTDFQATKYQKFASNRPEVNSFLFLHWIPIERSYIKNTKNPQNIYQICSWAILMIFICELEIDLIAHEPSQLDVSFWPKLLGMFVMWIEKYYSHDVRYK